MEMSSIHTPIHSASQSGEMCSENSRLSCSRQR